MRHFFLTIIMAIFAFGTALAASPQPLAVGDHIEISDGDALTVWKLRRALRQYGYHGFSRGDHTGHIIKITVYAPDRYRYRIKVHMYTGEVTQVRRLDHLD